MNKVATEVSCKNISFLLSINVLAYTSFFYEIKLQLNKCEKLKGTSTVAKKRKSRAKTSSEKKCSLCQVNGFEQFKNFITLNYAYVFVTKIKGPELAKRPIFSII